MADNPESGIVSSELLSHVRSAHFALIVVSVVIILTLQTPSTSKPRIAASQMRQLRTLKADWASVLDRFAREETRWLKDQGISWWSGPSVVYIKAALGKGSAEGDWSLPLVHAPFFLYLSPIRSAEGKDRLIVLTRAVVSASGELSFATEGSSAWPRTLYDMRQFWDVADKVSIQYTERVGDTVYVIAGDGTVSTFLWNDGAGVRQSSVAPDLRYNNLFGEARCSTTARQVLHFEHTFCSEDQSLGVTFVIPVSIRQASIHRSFRTWLLKEMALDRAPGSFNQTYPELDSVAKNYEDLPLERAASIVDAEASRGSEVVKLIGLDLPRDILSLWGGAIIVIVQCYLWLHMQILAAVMRVRALPTGYPCIMIYPGRLPRVISFLSVSVLPMVALIGMLISGFNLFALIAAVIGAWLAVVSADVLTKVGTLQAP